MGGNTDGETVLVEFGGQTAQVPKGGYYDRYRMNPNLDEVAQDPAVGTDLSFFQKFPKQLVNTRVGEIYAPNFYYRTNSVQLVFLAPLHRLQSALPAPLKPLAVLPGYGLVVLTFYSYLVCDNDPYNEVSVAIAVGRPGDNSCGLRQLLASSWNRTFYGHVLSLPVDTEIAMIRGVEAYQFPKWLANINFDVGHDRITATIQSCDGDHDLKLSAPLPDLKSTPSQSSIITNNAINKIDGTWSQVTVSTNPVLSAQCWFPRNVELSKEGGQLSQLLDGLGMSTLIRMDVLKDAQMVLNVATPLEKL
ncbi:unnamed protein product [Clonostachys rosea]|uniref:Acetoacetate decarboxylase n=1 Tax=Bionectria ochroleuca TaxID=29856 RepID=A0ABY6U613_BIOOC|nr:unnamed protein product [Clonostachys rosea]